MTPAELISIAIKPKMMKTTKARNPKTKKPGPAESERSVARVAMASKPNKKE